ncbi:MAG: 4-hydroxy-tetrahydrodipicolinate reductase, partial [Alphaproteobacteria bacterium]|nr:4-hydroxy-tetrahydrodipicolinate reductase [Alphaproteobacteria bacterium]
MKIGIIGCSGRMGRMLVHEVLAAEGCELAGGTERPGSDAVGRDIGDLLGLGPLGLTVVGEPERLFEVADAVIDFSVPVASARHAALAAGRGCGLVIGTTGLEAEHEAAILDASGRIPIVKAGNMSLGVNLLLAAVEQVARALGPAFDVEIVEMHHRHKVDAPSGTALMLGRAAAAGHAADLDAVARRS